MPPCGIPDTEAVQFPSLLEHLARLGPSVWKPEFRCQRVATDLYPKSAKVNFPQMIRFLLETKYFLKYFGLMDCSPFDARFSNFSNHSQVCVSKYFESLKC